MDSVHSWCYQEQVQAAFQRYRQPQARMVEQHINQKEILPHGVRFRRDADERNLCGLKRNGKTHFAEMETKRRGGVQIQIGVVHYMKTP